MQHLHEALYNQGDNRDRDRTSENLGVVELVEAIDNVDAIPIGRLAADSPKRNLNTKSLKQDESKTEDRGHSSLQI